MRPVRLQLTAFGAYPGTESVEFAGLGALGLFLVTGPTGSGKTTVFDALTYALYGRLPGGRPADVRSHHADADARCEVELVLEVEGVRYRVVRSPEQPRPKRRGTGTTAEPARAALFRVGPDGVEEPLEANPRLVTERCQEIVGLDLAQFERVVLLPQGRFQEFLLATTKDRLPILQQLFGSGLYARAVDELKRRSLDLAARVAEVTEEHRRHLGNARDRVAELVVAFDPTLELDADADADMVEAVLDKLGPPLEELGTQVDRLAREAAEAGARAATARDQARRWDTRAELHQRDRALDAHHDEVEAAAARLAEARRVAAVVEAEDQLARTAHDEADALAAERDAVAAARRALAGLDPEGPWSAADPSAPLDLDAASAVVVRVDDELAAVEAALAELGTARDAEAEARAQARRAEEAVAELDRRVEQLTEALARAREARDAVAGAPSELARLEAALPVGEARCGRRRDLAGLEDRIEEVVTAADRASAEAREAVTAFVAGAAPRLAATLEPGRPCPVCGGTDHPAPASGAGASAVDAATLERVQQAERAALVRRHDLLTRITALREELGGDAERPLEDVLEAHDELVARHTAAVASVRDHEELGVRIDEHLAELEAAGAARTHLVEARAAATEAAEAARLATAALAARVGPLDAEVVRARRAAAVDARQRLGACRRAGSEAERATGARESAGRALAEQLARVGLADAEAARARHLTPGQQRDAEELVEVWRAERDRVDGALAALDDDDLPVDRPDAEALTADAEHRRRAADRAADELTRLQQRADLAARGLDAAREVLTDAVGLFASADTATRVWRTCNGEGPGRVGLETWVLAGELDRVTEAANVHLQRMTAGRYQLVRTDQAGHGGRRAGLDLAVQDAHTGRERAPATLSGGEQFQASLALALGLADVVSQGGTGAGRVFESLFVDEGFGSLDPDALDQAVDALHQLRATGRMVGVITHVEAMKHQLPVGIEVRRRPDGRGSTLVASVGS